MTSDTPGSPHRPDRRSVCTWTAGALAGSLVLAGCGLSWDSLAAGTEVRTAAADVADGEGVWDAATLHEVSVEVADDALAAMIDTYRDSGEKEWVEATVTIDGRTIERAGLRLKGNSSLRGVSAQSDPAELPWLIRLDKFVDGRQVDGWSEFVVRSNTSETALNEAVALDLLREAGLASEYAVASSFVVNGSAASLRLVVQNLDERWEAQNFSTAGVLYKAEAGGDWSYRGEDPTAYEDVFDQETGDEDLTPLIELLRFVEESDDEQFVAELPERLDVAAFARYLAFEDVIGNFDDIDGPGNNAFLRYDAQSGGFTVVAWDHNLAFGGSPGGGAGGGFGGRGGAGREDGGDVTEGMPEGPEGLPAPEDLPEEMPAPLDGGGERPDGAPEQPGGAEGDRPWGDGDRPAGGLGGRGGSNPLVERFTAVQEWADLVAEETTGLTADLFDSGAADAVIDRWSSMLVEQAAHLVDPDTVQEEADAIRDFVG